MEARQLISILTLNRAFRKNQLYRIASMFALGLCQSFKFILDSSALNGCFT